MASNPVFMSCSHFCFLNVFISHICLLHKPDPGGMDRSRGIDGADNFAGVHVASVGGVGRDPMVLLDQRVEHIRKHLQQRHSQPEPLFF